MRLDEVGRTYDAFAPRYAAWADSIRPPLREMYTNLVLERVPRPARVLDLGCGPGVPVLQRLADEVSVVGVDVSAGMLEQARKTVPAAALVRADFAAIAFRQRSFDGVVAFHSLFHVARDQHAELFGRIAAWLRPGGLFVASLGGHDDPGSVEEAWLDVGPMYWSSFEPAEEVRLIERAGFTIQDARAVEMDEDGRTIPFLWVVGRAPQVS